MANILTASIDQVLYDKNSDVWYDMDLVERKLRTKFYPSNIYPLLLENIRRKKNLCERLVNYLHKSGALEFKGFFMKIFKKGFFI